MRLIKITFLLLLAFSLLFGAETIRRITVVGSEATSPELVRVNSGLNEGEPYSTSKIEDAIKSIYALGNFADVRILTTKGSYGYDIEIRVVELPRVESIEFDGNKKVDDDDLKKEINLVDGSFISDAAVFDAIKKIEKKYNKEGRYDVSIKYELKDGEQKSFKKLVFHIDEGKDLRIKQIKFVGNKEFSDKKLRKQMDTKQKGFLRSGKFDPEKYQQDLQNIEDFYHSKGYITTQITKDTLDKNDNGIFITIYLDEGKKYYLKDIAISGNEIFKSENLMKFFKLESGDIFNQKKMDQSIQNIYLAYSDDGYIHAQVNPEKQIADDSVSVNVSIVEGPQAHVRLINIASNTRTFEKIIRRELVLHPGNVFRRNLLVMSQRNVYFLNYFEDVVPEFNMLPNGDVDITLKVTEKPIGKFQVGAGYNAQDKLVGNISIGWPNVLGRGWSLDLGYEFGKLKNNFSISFTEPWLFDTPTSFGFDIYNTRWTWDGYYTEYRTGGAIRLGRKLWKPRYFTVSGRYKLESVKYEDIESNYTPSPAYDITTIDWPRIESSVLLTIERDSRNSQVFASKGSRNTISFENSGGIIGGQIEFQKLWLKSDWYFPAHKYLTLVGKAHFGMLENLWGNNADAVPFGERFFPGGVSFDGQIRGYSDRSVGPMAWTEAGYDSTAIPDADGRIPLTSPSTPYMPGSRAVLIFTTELRFPIMKDQLYVGFFADAGDAWLDPKNMKLKGLKRSVGVGARFVVPMMGILGIDFGYGFDKSTPGWEMHFQIGPEF
ncbi:outer membrane protein assembly factor BamA [bacterium]|nr:outer membrane protein assembly factor BamA [bacterium]